MAWSDPGAVTAATAITAAWGNAVRDDLVILGQAWTSYTPTWTASVNPALGNGTWACAYNQSGKTVDFRIKLTMGSTTTYGTGTWYLSLPVAPKAYDVNAFPCQMFDSSGSAWWQAGAFSQSAGLFLMYDQTAVSATGPWTWATGDFLVISGSYEAA
jgi:hypothetical protein